MPRFRARTASALPRAPCRLLCTRPPRAGLYRDWRVTYRGLGSCVCRNPQLRVVANTTGQRGTNSQTGAEFKADLHSGKVKFGIFVNSASPTVAEQLSFSGYDWLLVDCQHGPMEPTLLSTMLAAVSNGGAKSMVRVLQLPRMEVVLSGSRKLSPLLLFWAVNSRAVSTLS